MNIQGVKNFIVKVDSAYIEEYQTKGHDGSNLVRSHLFNDADNAEKSGIVISSPTDEVPVGARLFFHHAIVEWRAANAGGERYVIDEEKGLYRVPWRPMGFEDPLFNKAYAWEKDGEIHSINDWIFLEQEKEEFEKTESGLVLVKKMEDAIYSSGEEAPKQGYARVRFLNNHFRGMGLKEDDLVIMKKDAEYPIEINGKIYWRVWEQFLLARVDE